MWVEGYNEASQKISYELLPKFLGNNQFFDNLSKDISYSPYDFELKRSDEV